ncbi:tyrosine-type recombinase/integrase [Ferrimonas sediminicola]|uniref:tyrosine-type recombinase/integrase n=1 Tax=Ferrimonas sediminicola TaxID=2569538 RepID=UPI002277287D|nr:tyrosine-type recombinase/integrase [Ferrimonas sediminicola]
MICGAKWIFLCCCTSCLDWADSCLRVCSRVFLRRGPRGSIAHFSSPQLFENQNWAAIIRKAGLRYRVPYQTRHSYASWLLSAGVDPMYVATQMGHADWGMIRTTYGKWIPQDAQQHRQQVASKLGLKIGDFGTNMVHGNQS